jgi:YesN/AraC family two-component response regulator
MTLMIVDDEIFAIQGLLHDIDKELAGLDTILTANCYSQAVNIFMGSAVDILLCDIEMPFGSGLELAEWARENYPRTECIFLTCHDEFDYAKQAIRLKSLDYILKPASAATVNEALLRAVGHIREQREAELYAEYGKAYFSNISKPEREGGCDGDGCGCGSGKDAVEKVEEYIMLHLSEELTIGALASHAYISGTHLNRLFRARRNMSVNGYITERRMRAAEELLKTTNLSVASVSEKTGYGNYSYFIKLFKRRCGLTPREYRRRLGRQGARRG